MLPFLLFRSQQVRMTLDSRLVGFLIFHQPAQEEGGIVGLIVRPALSSLHLGDARGPKNLYHRRCIIILLVESNPVPLAVTCGMLSERSTDELEPHVYKKKDQISLSFCIFPFNHIIYFSFIINFSQLFDHGFIFSQKCLSLFGIFFTIILHLLYTLEKFYRSFMHGELIRFGSKMHLKSAMQIRTSLHIVKNISRRSQNKKDRDEIVIYGNKMQTITEIDNNSCFYDNWDIHLFPLCMLIRKTGKIELKNIPSILSFQQVFPWIVLHFTGNSVLRQKKIYQGIYYGTFLKVTTGNIFLFNQPKKKKKKIGMKNFLTTQSLSSAYQKNKNLEILSLQRTKVKIFQSRTARFVPTLPSTQPMPITLCACSSCLKACFLFLHKLIPQIIFHQIIAFIISHLLRHEAELNYIAVSSRRFLPLTLLDLSFEIAVNLITSSAENNWRTNSNNLSKTHHWSNPTRYFSLFKIIESLWVCFSPFDFLMSMLLVLVLSFYPSILHSSLLCGQLCDFRWQSANSPFTMLFFWHPLNHKSNPIKVSWISCVSSLNVFWGIKINTGATQDSQRVYTCKWGIRDHGYIYVRWLQLSLYPIVGSVNNNKKKRSSIGMVSVRNFKTASRRLIY
ncbi:hypothetical protein VP01_349g4 [Puccinia sorghi]|uniref:Uncharacterized protein n=1 Tax=Puccinia sorghi TaxID=27349 RepID=A0A0L6UVU7_9BASI|nr:hypothetical protein VP01_349g4 [Puccinia sorghi]